MPNRRNDGRFAAAGQQPDFHRQDGTCVNAEGEIR
jgi:hypothetical protein